MEPLTEENKKLREAVKLMEENIKRAQRERDLAESNSKDLEYQKVTLSEQFKTAFKQLERISEQKKVLWISEFVLCCRTILMLLSTVTFVEQDAELGQVRQVICRLQEEKEEALGQVEKLAKDLEGECCMVRIVDMIPSFDESPWCLQDIVEKPTS